jgi:hypothetical protein
VHTLRNRRVPRRSRLGLVVAAAGLALVLPLAGSEAATPSSGTVSSSNPTVTWTGGPTVATGGGCASADDASCDAYHLTINAPSTPFQVVVKLKPVGDWDLSVWAPDGALAGSSGNGPNQLEVVVLANPPSGTYTVTGAPFAPLVGADGNSYTASAELGPIDETQSGTPGTEPLSFADHPSPEAIGGDAGEPSIGANLKSGNVMFQAGLVAARVQFDDATSPARATWTDVSFPTASAASLDPIGVMDQRTGRWMSSQLSGTTSLAAITDNDGDLWIPSEGGPLNGGVDHQTIGFGPYAPPLTGTVYPDAAYYCSQDLVAALCARSDDGGVTFAPAVPIYTDECGGLHGHVKVAPDGTVYVPNRGCNGHQAVVVSEDNGLTWSVRPIPQSTPGAWDPSVGIASDGTVYVAYDDGDGGAKAAVSHDKGRTWVNVQNVGAQAGVAQSAFPVAVAGDADRAAVGFLGTSQTKFGAFGDDPSWPGVWYLYVSVTYDGGQTWTTVNATPNDPVQKGTICGGGFNGCDNGTRNLLDFMDATVDAQGRVLVGFADGCLDACVAGGPGTFSALATIARQVNGRRLFAQFDTAAAPGAPLLQAKSSAGPPPANVLSWQAPDSHNSPITSYTVYRKTASTAAAAIATVGGGATQYTDTAITAGETYTYTVTATNAVGESAQSNAVTPEAPAPPEDPCSTAGVRILSDGTGDEVDQQTGHDLQWLAVAEPPSIGSGNVEFILKTASLASVPKATTWPIVFKAGGADRFVRMQSDALGKVSFAYGDGSDGLTAGKPALAGSGYDSDGTIRIVAPYAAFGVGAGGTLTSFIVRVTIDGVAVLLYPDNMPDSIARTGSYAIDGSGCPKPQPNLEISSSDVTFSGLKGEGNDQVVVAVVHNTGTADATKVPVRFTIDGTQVGAVQTLARVAAGATARVSVVWDTHGANGAHTIAANADPANAIAESAEDDNAGSRRVTVQGSKVTG